MDSMGLIQKIVTILDKKKADDIQVIRVSDITSLGDYFIIASADNVTKVKSLVN